MNIRSSKEKQHVEPWVFIGVTHKKIKLFSCKWSLRPNHSSCFQGQISILVPLETERWEMLEARGLESCFSEWDSLTKYYRRFKKTKQETKNMISHECDCRSRILWNDLFNFPKQTEMNENLTMFSKFNWGIQGVNYFQTEIPTESNCLCFTN